MVEKILVTTEKANKNAAIPKATQRFVFTIMPPNQIHYF